MGKETDPRVRRAVLMILPEILDIDAFREQEMINARSHFDRLCSMAEDWDWKKATEDEGGVTYVSLAGQEIYLPFPDGYKKN